MTARGTLATFIAVVTKPRAFFTALGEGEAPTNVGPVRFVLLLTLVVMVAKTGVDALFMGDASSRDAASIAGAVLLTPLFNVVALYATALLVHGALRVLRGAARPFAITLACCGFASAPLALAIMPVVGSFASLLAQIALLTYALTRAQRCGVVRGAIGATVNPAFFVLLALFLRLFVVEAFNVPSGSMTPTIVVGDHLFINKLAVRVVSAEERGDVVVFRFPEKREQDFVKRVVATAGDTLEVVDGRPVVNGAAADVCYVGATPWESHEAHMYVEVPHGGAPYLTLHDHQARRDRVHVGRVVRRRGPRVPSGRVRRARGPVQSGGRRGVRDGRQPRQRLRLAQVARRRYGLGVPYADVKGRFSLVWMGLRPDGSVDTSRFGASPTDLRLPADAIGLAAARDQCVAHLAHR